MLSESTTRALLRQAADTVEVAPLHGEAIVEAARRRRRQTWAMLSAAAATAAVVSVAMFVGTGPDTRPPPEPAPAGPSEVTSPSEEPASHATVPILTKYVEDAARQRVQDQGLTAIVVYQLEPCRPAGFVIDQQPRAGAKVPTGTRVTLVVVDQASEKRPCPRGVSFDDDHALASALYKFARGAEGATVPWAPEVTLVVLDGAMRTTLTEREASKLDSWQMTMTSDDFRLDIDVFAELAASEGAYRVDIGPHPVCVGPERAPESHFNGLRQVSIAPTAPRESCLDWWAVDIFVNDVDQIEGVVLERWEW